MAEAVVHYFAYGANMDPARLPALGVAWLGREAACLEDYALSFSAIAGDADGVAYATVVPDTGRHVEGILYRLPAGALAVLDAFEDVPQSYRRESVVVRAAGRRQHGVHVYVAQAAQVRAGLAVEDWYLGYLLAGADLLSPAWRASLRAQPVVSSPPRW